MLEEIYDFDEALTEDEFYDALIYLLGDAYPDLSEEELEDLLEDIVDQLPEQYAESVLNTVGTIGKKFGTGALKFAKDNPALVKGGLKAVGTVVGGPIGAKVAGGLGNLITQSGQNKPLPETGKMLALMQNPQAQAAMALGTMGIGNGTAPLSINNGYKTEIPAHLYLRAMIAVAQSALKEMDRNNVIPPASYSESLPYADDVDKQAEWLVEQLIISDNPYISSNLPENNVWQGDSEVLLIEDTIGSPTDNLLKFLVHFERPKIFKHYKNGNELNYAGQFGFDKLRDEYQYPIEIVNIDNDGTTAIGVRKPLCKNIATLKATYLKGVKNVIKPYEKDYYPCWFTIFPHTTTAQFAHGSRLHRFGINLSLELEEIDSLSKKDNYIQLKSDDPRLTIKPEKITLNTFLKSATKKTKTIDFASGKTKSSWILRDAINIKCEGGTIDKHTEIKVFAVGKDKTEQVGQLMAYANNVIPKAEIVLVKVVINHESVDLRKSMDDHEYILKYQSFNQALIRAEIEVDTEFKILDLDATDPSVISFKAKYGGLTAADADAFLQDIKNLYEKFGKYKPASGKIDNAKRTYLFITEVKHTGDTTGIADLQSLTVLSKSYSFWQNACVVFKPALEHNTTFIHELGHTLSLFHSFEGHSSNSGPQFYHGFTDNAMDYDWKFDGSSNPYAGRRFYFYRWQWDIIRGDKSLIAAY